MLKAESLPVQNDYFSDLIDAGLKSEVYRNLNQKPWIEDHASFDYIIKTPPAAVQLIEASKVSKGSPEPNRKKVAAVTWDQVKAIAEDKMVDLNAFTIESAMKMIAGTARSMGFTVSGTPPWGAK